MSSSTAPRPTMHSSLPYRWLWADDHVVVTRWFVAQDMKYKTFYGSFLNFCNAAWQKHMNPEWVNKHGGLSALEQAACSCLCNDPIPSDDLINVLDGYKHFVGGGSGRYRENGPVSFDGPMDMKTMEAASDELHHQVHTPMQGQASTTRLQRKNARRRAARRAEREAAKSSAAAATADNAAQQPGLAGQLPLPGGPPPSLLLQQQQPLGPAFFAAPLPAVQKPLSVSSLGSALPAGDSAASHQQTQQQQQVPQHGALVFRSGAALEEDEDDEDDEDEIM